MPRLIPQRLLIEHFEPIMITTYLYLRVYDESHPLLKFLDAGEFNGVYPPKTRYKRAYKKAYVSRYKGECSQLYALLEYHDDLSAALNLYIKE